MPDIEKQGRDSRETEFIHKPLGGIKADIPQRDLILTVLR